MSANTSIPKLIQYDRRFWALDVESTKKKNVLPVALEGKHNTLIVRFGKTYGVYVEVPAPQAIETEQIELYGYATK